MAKVSRGQRRGGRERMSPFGRRLLLTLRVCGGLAIGAGSWSLYAAMSAPAVSAATLGGTATIASPNGTNPPIASGGSETVFTVTLPPEAACSEDTANHQYHVFSYLLPQGTSVTSDNFNTGVPSEGLGLVDANGDYYGPANTAPDTGQIIDIPNDFEWAGLLKVGEKLSQLLSGGGLWNAGIACANPSGVVTDYWNTQVTFTANSSDPNGFVFTDVPGVGTTTTTTTAGSGSTTTTTASASTTNSTAGSTGTTSGSGSSGSGSSGSGASGGSGSGSAAAGSSGGSSASGSGSDGGSASDTGSSGSLAFTGGWAARDLLLGMLLIGLGLILWGVSMRLRRDIANRSA